MSEEERYCAWYADAAGERLYLGLSAFWSAMWEASGDPLADRMEAGPRVIGVFDLTSESHLPAIALGEEPAPTGVWDVLHHQGRLWFTTYFALSGHVAPDGSDLRYFEDAGHGLAELAPGPGDGVLATRYGLPGQRGAVLVLDAGGAVRAEHPLEVHDGVRPAPKTPAWDPVRREIWVNADLFVPDGSVAGKDVRVLDEDGRERLRYADPEVQYVLFAEDGTGYLAEHDADGLWLRILAPGEGEAPHASGRRLLLDADFAGDFDFAQELRRTADGTLLVTRWSGAVHALPPGGDAPVRLDLPRIDESGLYYASVLRNGRLCATHCADATVVCRDAPPELFR